MQGEGHTAAGRGVLDTIVHQIQQQPPQAFIIPLDGRRVQRPWLYGEALGSSQDPGLSHDLRHQLSQVHWLAVHAQHSRIGPRQQQQALHEPGDALALLQRTGPGRFGTHQGF